MSPAVTRCHQYEKGYVMQLSNLKQVRKEKGVRAADLAKAASLTPGRIHQIEHPNSPKSSTTARTAIVLALILGVNVDDLRGEAGPGSEVAHTRPLVGQKGGMVDYDG